MKRLLPCLALTLILSSATAADVDSQQPQTFAVTLDSAVHGSFSVDPALPRDGRYPAGTVVTVTTKPNADYTLDAGYYSVPGRWGSMYHESMTPTFKVTIDRDKHIGASFIEESQVAHLDVRHNIVYAQPGVKPLKYDVFSPKGAKNLPIIVIIHGGGWTTNNEDVMRGLARELTRGGKFVACSIDYRWLGKADGDATPNTMANLIEDCYGAIAHIMQHAADYGGDPTRIGVTGDSAGGHLSASVSLMVERIGERGFGRESGVFEFKPTYIPAGKTVAQLRTDMLTAIRAAAPSYGVFEGQWLKADAENPAADESWNRAIMPLHSIPPASVRSVPQYLTRGTKDPLISDKMNADFMAALVAKGQRVQYVQIGGAQHAFFDWKPDALTQSTFYEYGVYYAAEMKAFFASVLYPDESVAAAKRTGRFTYKRGVNISHWLSQNNEARPYAANWFDEEDVAWIAAQGFDHIRYPIDGREWLRPDGSLDDAKIAPFERALAWTRSHGLGAILDMHFLPGASFDPGKEDKRVFTDTALQENVADLWRRAAKRFAAAGPELRFELLNEPIAEDNRQLNPFNLRMLRAIRESNPSRVVYITSNLYGSFSTVNDLEVPKDPNVAVTLHTYAPFVFTHQRASWARFPAEMPLVRFPGKVPDLSAHVPADHFAAKEFGTELTVAAIDAEFEKIAAWAREHTIGQEIHIGEFGVYRPADDDSKRNYISAVVHAAERHGFGWAVWDYQGGFAVRDPDGSATPILEGLFAHRRARK